MVKYLYNRKGDSAMAEFYLCDAHTIVEALDDRRVFFVVSKRNDFGTWTVQGRSADYETELFLVSDRLYKLLELWDRV